MSLFSLQEEKPPINNSVNSGTSADDDAFLSGGLILNSINASTYPADPGALSFGGDMGTDVGVPLFLPPSSPSSSPPMKGEGRDGPTRMPMSTPLLPVSALMKDGQSFPEVREVYL